jgi:hypothetical protein
LHAADELEECVGTSSTGSLSSLLGTSSSAIFAPPLSLSVAQGIDVHCACFPVGWRLWLGIATAETMAVLANTRKKMSLANNPMTINLSIYGQVGGKHYAVFFLRNALGPRLPKMAGKSQGLAETSQGRFSHLFKKVCAHVFGVYMYM